MLDTKSLQVLEQFFYISKNYSIMRTHNENAYYEQVTLINGYYKQNCCVLKGSYQKIACDFVKNYYEKVFGISLVVNKVICKYRGKCNFSQPNTSKYTHI